MIDPDIGKGLPIWLPQGEKIKSLLQELIRSKLGGDYLFVDCPHVGQESLYRQSGHLAKYENDMLPLAGGGYLKPMGCPHHIKAFQALQPQLPARIAEFSRVYRNEQSGELNGLLRCRSFIQDDGHIFARNEQVKEEIEKLISLFASVYEDLELAWECRLSLRDDQDGYIGSSHQWDEAENILRELLPDARIGRGEAAFYGPKIDFIVRDRLEREWQVGTIQLDYNLPKRFNLGEDIVLIHRAICGSLERMIAILLESGLPAAIAPIQCAILPVGDRNLAYAEKIQKSLELRSVIIKEGHLSKRIKFAHKNLIPKIAIVGDKEEQSKKIQWRK